ncbi:hypothetical protein GX50_07986 [[Emmonsia] crescens]|uniref:Uncharacterized protein n=1 Tax=[Emmonsia] crescens TaxID=73230 RepID=A0A2B7Z7D4_9EURO|nr:hypothetical protein GX50_07986 [Emmonsia crescens]
MEPCACWMVGGWTYALNSGGLLGFNIIGNVPFIIAEAFSVAVPSPVFWIIFNLGGTIGSIASFGLNFHKQEDAASNSNASRGRQTYSPSNEERNGGTSQDFEAGDGAEDGLY